MSSGAKMPMAAAAGITRPSASRDRSADLRIGSDASSRPSGSTSSRRPRGRRRAAPVGPRARVERRSRRRQRRPSSPAVASARATSIAPLNSRSVRTTGTHRRARSPICDRSGNGITTLRSRRTTNASQAIWSECARDKGVQRELRRWVAGKNKGAGDDDRWGDAGRRCLPVVLGGIRERRGGCRRWSTPGRGSAVQRRGGQRRGAAHRMPGDSAVARASPLRSPSATARTTAAPMASATADRNATLGAGRIATRSRTNGGSATPVRVVAISPATPSPRPARSRGRRSRDRRRASARRPRTGRALPSSSRRSSTVARTAARPAEIDGRSAGIPLHDLRRARHRAPHIASRRARSRTPEQRPRGLARRCRRARPCCRGRRRAPPPMQRSHPAGTVAAGCRTTSEMPGMSKPKNAVRDASVCRATFDMPSLRDGSTTASAAAMSASISVRWPSSADRAAEIGGSGTRRDRVGEVAASGHKERRVRQGFMDDRPGIEERQDALLCGQASREQHSRGCGKHAEVRAGSRPPCTSSTPFGITRIRSARIADPEKLVADRRGQGNDPVGLEREWRASVCRAECGRGSRRRRPGPEQANLTIVRAPVTRLTSSGTPQWSHAMWLCRISGCSNPARARRARASGDRSRCGCARRPSAGTGTTRGFRWLIDARSTLELGA